MFVFYIEHERVSVSNKRYVHKKKHRFTKRTISFLFNIYGRFLAGISELVDAFCYH